MVWYVHKVVNKGSYFMHLQAWQRRFYSLVQNADSRTPVAVAVLILKSTANIYLHAVAFSYLERNRVTYANRESVQACFEFNH